MIKLEPKEQLVFDYIKEIHFKFLLSEIFAAQRVFGKGKLYRPDVGQLPCKGGDMVTVFDLHHHVPGFENGFSV